MEFVDKAVRHVELRQGVLGVQIKILPDYDKAKDYDRGTGKARKIMPDNVRIIEPKDDRTDYDAPEVQFHNA